MTVSTTQLPELSERDRVRFFAKVNQVENGCWEWTSAKQPTGYGLFFFKGAARLAHRISWTIAHGTIPDGLMIDHRCHNRGCVNPEHLWLATRKQNGENLAHARSDSRTGIRGVEQRKNGRWRAYIVHNGVNTHLGFFGTAEEASTVAAAKRSELFTHSQN